MKTYSGININENNTIRNSNLINDNYGKVWGYQNENILYLGENEPFISFEQCKIAKPLFLSYRQLPLVGELVLLFNLPSSDPLITNKKLETYYFPPINIWESSTHGSQVEGVSGLYKTYNLEKGDTIYEGRYENYLLFKEGRTILKNQSSQIVIQNENINISSNIINSDSKELNINVLKNIKIKSDKYTEIISSDVLKMDSKKIFLGGDSQSVLKGNDTVILLSELMKSLSIFSSKISNTISTPPGSLLPNLNIASIELSSQIIKLMGDLEKLLSEKVYV